MSTLANHPLLDKGFSPDIDFHAPIGAGMLAMSVMCGYGDLKQIWNAANADEVIAAQAVWDELVGKKKYLAFKINPDGTNGEQIRAFDPTVGKMLLCPPVAGGCQ